MTKTIRIGTRNSPLALWQANKVKHQLEKLGYTTQLIPITSTGDIILDKPLYELGIIGIFTKTLDVAMLQGKIDIAVHSMKDVPTTLPQNIIQTAVLKRASVQDIIVAKKVANWDVNCTIATGSLRRKAQWLNRYPNHLVVGLRGNVQTRLEKLKYESWQGAIFAKAGLDRLEYLNKKYIKSPSFNGIIEELDWMIPAPAQGAMVVVAMEKDSFTIEATSKLNDEPSEICTNIEREFLKVLEGGCTAPIGAYAKIIDKKIIFKGILLSLDGSKKIEVNETTEIEHWNGFGKRLALQLVNNGGKELMEQIKRQMNS